MATFAARSRTANLAVATHLQSSRPRLVQAGRRPSFRFRCDRICGIRRCAARSLAVLPQRQPLSFAFGKWGNADGGSAIALGRALSSPASEKNRANLEPRLSGPGQKIKMELSAPTCAAGAMRRRDCRGSWQLFPRRGRDAHLPQVPDAVEHDEVNRVGLRAL